MAKQTPEGRVKKAIIDVVNGLENCFYYMPSQNGFGQTGIPDIFILYKTIPFWVETKSTPSHQPTTLQAKQLEKIHKVGTPSWVIDQSNVGVFVDMLNELKDLTPAKAIKRAKQFEKDHPETLRWNKKLEVVTLESAKVVEL